MINQKKMHPLRLWEMLTTPSGFIIEPERRRRARMLSALLLATLLLVIAAFFLTIFNISPLVASIRERFSWIGLFALFSLGLAYWLSRTRYTEQAAIFSVAIILLATFVAAITNPGVKFVRIFPILGGLMGSQFLPRRISGLTFGIALVVIFVLPVMMPGHPDPELGIAAFFILAISVIMVLGSNLQHLDLEQIEQQTRVLSEREASLKLAVQSSLETNEKLAERVDELNQRSAEITLLSRMGQMLQACQTDVEAYEVIAQFARQLFPINSGAVYLIKASRNYAEAVVSWGAASQSLSERLFSVNECWALRRGQTHLAQQQEAEVICQHVQAGDRAAFAYICVPMIAQGEALGVLHLTALDSVQQLGESQRHLAQAVAEELSLALANLKLRETLRHQSIRDPLTGLFNRRYFEETFDRELQRAVRNQTSLGVIMLDIDHFKRFNDTLGHQAGDALLQELGRFLAARIRGADIASRYGGEEFVLILPDSTQETSRKLAEELREGIASLKVPFRGQNLEQVTISLGVAAFPSQGVEMDALLRLADAALYRAKQAGRNRVVLA